MKEYLRRKFSFLLSNFNDFLSYLLAISNTHEQHVKSPLFPPPPFVLPAQGWSTILSFLELASALPTMALLLLDLPALLISCLPTIKWFCHQ